MSGLELPRRVALAAPGRGPPLPLAGAIVRSLRQGKPWDRIVVSSEAHREHEVAVAVSSHHVQLAVQVGHVRAAQWAHAPVGIWVPADRQTGRQVTSYPRTLTLTSSNWRYIHSLALNPNTKPEPYLPSHHAKLGLYAGFLVRLGRLE